MKKLWILPIAAMTMVACGGGEAAVEEAAAEMEAAVEEAAEEMEEAAADSTMEEASEPAEEHEGHDH